MNKSFFLRLLVSLILISLCACTNPNVKIAVEAIDPDVRQAALEKLTDQSLVLKIALNDTDEYVRKAAIEKLTEALDLAKVAFESINYYEQLIAIRKLNTTAMLAKLSVPNKDREVQLIYKLMSQFSKVPQDHSTRLISKILPAILILNKSEIQNIVGKIISISIEWSSTGQKYLTSKWQDIYRINGERFRCSIKLNFFSKPISYTWSTNFPSVTSDFSFRPAEINVKPLLNPVFEQFPQSLLEKIALGNNDIDVRLTAIENMTNFSLLAKIVIEDNSEAVRYNVVKLLNDQTILKKIVVDEMEWWIRQVAVEKLTDLVFLEKVALEDFYWQARKAAVKKLTNLTTLTKIALEDKEKAVRLAAKDRISLLQKTTH